MSTLIFIGLMGKEKDKKESNLVAKSKAGPEMALPFLCIFIIVIAVSAPPFPSANGRA